MKFFLRRLFLGNLKIWNKNDSKFWTSFFAEIILYLVGRNGWFEQIAPRQRNEKLTTQMSFDYWIRFLSFTKIFNQNQILCSFWIWCCTRFDGQSEFWISLWVNQSDSTWNHWRIPIQLVWPWEQPSYQQLNLEIHRSVWHLIPI